MNYILSTVCSGIGSPEQAAEELSLETPNLHKIGFYCEINKYARASYEAMFNAGFMVEDMTKQEWEGDEFYSDLFIGGIPCQAFSMAGLRKGELDPRGLLFYDYYRYVKKQKPKAFIIENVKGLLSDANGKTFQNWLHLLGQSVNGHHQMFNSPDSLPYNLHFTVLNTKDFGIPQNRERVFLVGIRDDIPNTFSFPKGEPLKLRLKDILEQSVDEKYYLSDKMLNYLNNRKDNFNNGKINYKHEDDIASCINASSKSVDISDNDVVTNVMKDSPVIVDNNNGAIEERQLFNCIDAHYYKGLDNHSQRSYIKEPKLILFGNLNQPGHNESIGRINSPDGLSPSLMAKQGGGHEPKIIQSARGYNQGGEHEICPTISSNSFENNNHVVIPNFDFPDKVFQLETSYEQDGRVYSAMNIAPTTDTKSERTKIIENHISNRIRRLTPLECWRLQGFPDEQFYKSQKVNSDSQLYKQAGNSMTKHVIKAIMKNVLNCILK